MLRGLRLLMVALPTEYSCYRDANSNNYHIIICQTNFGDSHAGTWANGHGYNTSKNGATGEVAAHIYETAGTYTEFTSCSDGTSTGSTSNSITVYDPEDATNGWGANTKTGMYSQWGFTRRRSEWLSSSSFVLL